MRDDEPLRPRQLSPSVPRDLETICMQCLRKSPSARYASAAALAEDLRRYLDGRTVLARRQAPHLRLRSWARRHPGQAVGLSAGILLAAVLVASSLSVAGVHRDLQHRSDLIAAAATERLQRDGPWRTRALEALARAWRIRPSELIRDEIVACLALPQISHLGEFPKSQDPPDASRSGDGTRIARSTGGIVTVVDVTSNKVIANIPADCAGEPILKLDDSGARIAIAAAGHGAVRLLDVADGSEIAVLQHLQPVHSLDWAGELLAVACTDRFVYIWTDDGTLRHRLAGHEGDFPIARFRNRGQEIVTLANDKWLRVWHAARGEEIARLQSSREHHLPAWFGDDGITFHATSSAGHETRFSIDWSICLEILAPPADEIHAENRGTIALDRSGDLVASVDERECRMRDFATGRLLASVPKGAGEWVHLRFSPGGENLWLCGWDEGLRSVPLVPEPGTASVAKFGAGYLLHDLSADGRFALLANTSENHPEVSVFDLRTDQRVAKVPQTNCLAASLSPDGSLLVTSAYDSPGATVWALPEGGQIQKLETAALVTVPPVQPGWEIAPPCHRNWQLPGSRSGSGPSWRRLGVTYGSIRRFGARVGM